MPINKQDVPEPDDDESHSEFMDRCVSEMSDDMDEGDAEDACQVAWEDRRAHGVVHKTHAADVNGMEFILSDESVDRMGDVIVASGWDLKAFAKNPIALAFHNPGFPIGKWNNLRIEKGELRGHLEMAPLGTSPRIDELRRLIDAGILRP
jgi:hypothetical protein